MNYADVVTTFKVIRFKKKLVQHASELVKRIKNFGLLRESLANHFISLWLVRDEKLVIDYDQFNAGLHFSKACSQSNQ